MNDTDEFLALDKIAFQHQAALGHAVLSEQQQRERFQQALPVSQLCTVRRDGALVAYAMMQPRTDSCWFVTCFNIHPQHRSAPVLLELFSAFGALVLRLGITELYSNVYKTNQLSLSFHRRLGFRVTKQNEEAVEMFTTVAEMMSSAAIERTLKRLGLSGSDQAGHEPKVSAQMLRAQPIA